MAGRIPFGYKIVGGKAFVDPSEAGQLKLFFRRFLEGETMAAAAKEAGLDFSPPTYPHLLKRREYIGTDYYPPLITAEYRQQLIDEWERRRTEHPRKPKKTAAKSVRVYTDFRLEKYGGDAPEPGGRQDRRYVAAEEPGGRQYVVPGEPGGQQDRRYAAEPEDLLARAEAVYRRIRPNIEKSGQ